MKLADVYKIKAQVKNGVSNKDLLAAYGSRYSKEEIEAYLPKKAAPKKKAAAKK